MGLPEINIVFQSKAETAIKRSANGIVALILRDATKGDITSYSYTNESEVVKSHWTTANYDYISKTFLGGPQRVIVERIGAEDTYDDALARLKNKKWNYLAIPSLADNEKDIADWIIAQRNAKKTFKAVLPYAANNEGIINFATNDIKVGTKVYTTAEYCCRIAGLLAGLPMTEGATYQTLAEVESITESTTPDDDIDGGKFILINDGEKVKVGRGVNSLVTLSGDKTEDMKKIKIIDSLDLIRDDIKASFEENYINVVNSHENKCCLSVRLISILSRCSHRAYCMTVPIAELILTFSRNVNGLLKNMTCRIGQTVKSKWQIREVSYLRVLILQYRIVLRT